jgi:hypothetical protein
MCLLKRIGLVLFNMEPSVPFVVIDYALEFTNSPKFTDRMKRSCEKERSPVISKNRIHTCKADIRGRSSALIQYTGFSKPTASLSSAPHRKNRPHVYIPPPIDKRTIFDFRS